MNKDKICFKYVNQDSIVKRKKHISKYMSMQNDLKEQNICPCKQIFNNIINQWG